MKIRELTKDYERLWDEWVKKSNETTFYHQIGWRNVVQRTYKHKPIYLIAEGNNEIKGILPIFHMKSVLFGSKLVSIPFAPYGGVCAESEEAEKLLIEEAKNIVVKDGSGYLELRHTSKRNISFVTSEAYVTLILELSENPVIAWEKLNKKVRNATRKAIKSGLEVISGKKYLDEFYRVYVRGMRDLGTPPHHINFFRNLLIEFPEKTEIAVVKHRDDIIASMFILFFKDTAIAGWASAEKEYFGYNPNNLLYWEVVKDCCERRYKYFDFGRSLRGSGTFRFKEHWGAKPTQLHYQYYLNKVKGIPSVTQESPTRKKFAKVWNKLPLSLTKLIGPKIRRNFP